MNKLSSIFLFLVLLTACTDREDINTQKPVSALSTSDLIDHSGSISVAGPFTISRNDLFSITNKHEYLSLYLVKGKYFEDWSPGPFMGRNWTGEFQLVLSDEFGNKKSAITLNDHFNDDLVFNSLFDLEFDDYNGDGNIDFTIGQYGSSNGNIYKMFTIDAEGKIEEIKIKDYNDLFISGTGRYSTRLEKIDDHTFKKSYYDNSTGKQLEDVFEWNGNEFIKKSNIVLKMKFKVNLGMDADLLVDELTENTITYRYFDYQHKSAPDEATTVPFEEMLKMEEGLRVYKVYMYFNSQHSEEVELKLSNDFINELENNQEFRKKLGKLLNREFRKELNDLTLTSKDIFINSRY